MQDGSLADLPPADAAVCTYLRAQRLAVELAGWAAQYLEVLNPAYIWPTALTVTHTVPFGDDRTLLVWAQYGVWLSSFDDVVDERCVSIEETDALVARCRAAAHGEHAPQIPLVQSLADIRDGSGVADGPDKLTERWQEAFDGLLDGMRYQWFHGHRVAAGAPGPDPAEYLVQGAWSVGVPAGMAIIWCGMRDDPTLIDHLPVLWGAALSAARAVRLSNDLGDLERERAEQTLNIGMLGFDKDRIRMLIDDAVSESRTRLGPLLAGNHPGAVALDRMTTWLTSFFEAGSWKNYYAQSPQRAGIAKGLEHRTPGSRLVAAVPPYPCH